MRRRTVKLIAAKELLDTLRLALSDAAHGRLRVTMVASLGPEEGVAALTSRVGPELFKIYFNDDLEAAGEGWKVSADGLLLLKIKHDKLAVRIDVAR